MGKAAHRRHDERERPAPPSFRFRRVSLLATGAIALSILLAALAGPSIAIVVYRLLIDLPLLLLWLAAAAGYGSAMPVRRDRGSAGGLGLVTDIALGLGVVSLLQLGLGVVGLIGAAP